MNLYSSMNLARYPRCIALPPVGHGNMSRPCDCGRPDMDLSSQVEP